ncbi:MAG: beta-propeller fold lactonase family protein [Candidatus Binataceae bacterium]
MAVILCACGGSFLGLASVNATSSATSTATTAPFLFVSSSDGNIAGFSSNSSSGALTLLSSSPTSAGSSASLVGIAVLPGDNFLYAVDKNQSLVDTFAIGSYGSLSQPSGGSVATGKGPYGIAIDPTGSFAYVTNFTAGTISGYAIESSGLLTPLTTPTVASGLSGPEGVALATASGGGLFMVVAENTGGKVDSFGVNSDGSLVLASSISIGGSPRQVALYPTGSLAYVTHVTASGDGAVEAFAVGSNGTLSFFSAGSFDYGAAASPVGIAIATNDVGTLFYVANSVTNPVNSFTNTVSQFILNSNSTLVANGTAPAPSPGLSAPTGIVVDYTGAFVYVASNGNGMVAQYTINSDGTLGSPRIIGTGTTGPMFLAFVAY